jgi:hypothetical protein
MSPYDCVATGNELGMIEAVKNSVTTAYIQQVRGVGLYRALSGFVAIKRDYSGFWSAIGGCWTLEKLREKPARS